MTPPFCADLILVGLWDVFITVASAVSFPWLSIWPSTDKTRRLCVYISHVAFAG